MPSESITPSGVCEECGRTFYRKFASEIGHCCSRQCSGAHRALSLVERFWSHVDKSGNCWLWTAAIDSVGYGHLRQNGYRGPTIKAHRLSWQLAYGHIPIGLQVLHSCDATYPTGDITYRRCVNPDHLFLGTALVNVRDMYAKGRAASQTHPDDHVCGEKNGSAKLTKSIVEEIRRLYAMGGVTQYALAQKHGVTQSAIQGIISRKTWKHA